MPPLSSPRCVLSKDFHFVNSKISSKKNDKEKSKQNRNYSITVTRVTVVIDKNEARIRVPHIEKPLATSFCEKKNSTGPYSIRLPNILNL
jgi:hypothetical protein